MALLHHQRNDAVLRELARVYVGDALRRWLPAVELLSMVADQDNATLSLQMRVREDGVWCQISIQQHSDGNEAEVGAISAAHFGRATMPGSRSLTVPWPATRPLNVGRRGATSAR